MVNVFIFHGLGGNPSENWFPWLKKELEDLGHCVFVPAFPTPHGQDLDSWLKVWKNFEANVAADSIFVGHSLGAVFILSLLEKTRVKSAFLVGGFTGSLGISNFDELNASFSEKLFDWVKIRENCPKFFIFQGDNDPFVSMQKALSLQSNLNGFLIVIKNGGHLNQGAGFTSFPQLLQAVESQLI